MAHVSANVVQTSFAGFEDDAALGSATQIGTNNTNWTQDTGANFRVRFEVSETNGGSANNYNLVLYYNTGGGWALVTSSTPVQFATSSNVSDGTAITGAGHFGNQDANGEFDSNGTVANVSLNNQQTEMEYCLTIDSAQVADEDTIQLRAQNSGTALDSYTNSLTVTVNEPAAPITGSGGADSDDSATDGTGERTVTGSGSAASDDSVTDGTGSTPEAPTGAIEASAAVLVRRRQRLRRPPALLIAAATVVTGSGAANSSGASTDGVGERVVTGAGSAGSDDSASNGSGERGAVGSGSAGSDDSSTSGAGERAVTGSGGAVSGDSATSGGAEGVTDGTGSAVSQDAETSGTGARASVGTGAALSGGSVTEGSGSSIPAGSDAVGSGGATAGPSATDGAGAVISTARPPRGGLDEYPIRRKKSDDPEVDAIGRAFMEFLQK